MRRVDILRKLRNINLNELWEKEQEWLDYNLLDRKYNDCVELKFWKDLAPRYSEKFNLYRDVPGLGEWLHQKIGNNKRLLEVGCGVGNFTIPFSKYSKEILAVDFSPAMLNELLKNIEYENIENIRMHHSKWEEFEEPYDADFVVSVNSLYRVRYMETALKKISEYGKQGFFIIRTVYKPYLHEIFDELRIEYKINSDYMFMPMMLWNMGISANVQYTRYGRPISFQAWNDIEGQMIDDIGEDKYLQYKDELSDRFLQKAVKGENGFTYISEQIIEIIYSFKDGSHFSL